MPYSWKDNQRNTKQQPTARFMLMLTARDWNQLQHQYQDIKDGAKLPLLSIPNYTA